MINARSLLLVISLVLLAAGPSRAEVGALVLEPMGPLGFFTRVGHAGTYFSNICPDGSPVRMRLCLPGESGGVVSKYSPLSAHEDYDWAIVPFEEYMHGFESAELAPLIGTPRLQHAIAERQFGPLFSPALAYDPGGGLPEGQWKYALATRFLRTIYLYSVETSIADDATLVAAFNAAPNKSRFNFFYRNCSDQARRIFDLILPDIDLIGDRLGGVTMETPKGLAKKLVAHGLDHPELRLRVRRYPQIPGTFGRSRDVLFPMENTYKSIGFAPWWFFGGFREVAFGAIVYHEVISPFDMLRSARDFISPEAAALTFEQHRLRRTQDEIGQALAAAQNHRAGWSALSQLNARVFDRLGEIRTQKRAAVMSVVGSKARWRELEQGFQSIVRSLAYEGLLPAVLERPFAQFTPDGTLSEQLLNHVATHADFHVDPDGRGPWISMPLVDGQMSSTGLSTSGILSGDPRLAALVLAAVVDYNLYQGEARREDLGYVEGLFVLLRQAIDTMRGREAGTR